MCGIAGVVGEPPEGSADAVKRMLGLIEHRGPDSEGVKSYSGKTPATIGAVRLRILDLSPAADQPMVSDEGDVCVAYNGEFFAWKELRAQLERDGADFRTNTDTEVLLHLYKACDGDVPSMLARLRGMFAFAIWDDARQRLVLARDRLGIKPLYWCRTRHGLTFASEARSLAQVRNENPTPNLDAVASYVAWGVVPGTPTIFAGVERLPAGHYLVWDQTGCTITGWWQPTFQHDDALGDEDECQRVLASVLSDSVARHLVADREVGVFLSGGTDSGVVAQLAAQHGRPRALTVMFPDAPSPDASDAKRIADALGLPHTLVPITGAEVAAEINAVLRAMDQPTSDAVNSWVVCRAAHHAGLVVALSGIGGDELFAGYPTFNMTPRLAHLGRGLQMVPIGVRRAIGRRASTRRPGGRLTRTITTNGTVGDAYAAIRRLFSNEELERLGVADHDGNPTSVGAITAVDAVTKLELERYLRDQLLPDTDSISMAFSLEVRVPLLDDAVVRTAMAIPPALRARSRKTLLAAAAGLPTPTTKRPFTLPFDQWLRGPLRSHVRDALFDESLPFSDMIDQSFRHAIWRAFEARRTHWSRPWALAVLRTWPAANGLSW